MTPDQLAKSGSEHAHQVALFAWVAVATIHGFGVADAWAATGNTAFMGSMKIGLPMLKWMHAIPNGGTRGDDAKTRAIRGGALKAEGVRQGVGDTFLPYPVFTPQGEAYAGLYIEMKKPSLNPKSATAKGGLSDEQIEFSDYVTSVGYIYRVCYTWLEAANVVKWYIGLTEKMV